MDCNRRGDSRNVCRSKAEAVNGEPIIIVIEEDEVVPIDLDSEQKSN